jgi:hypothetical protein
MGTGVGSGSSGAGSGSGSGKPGTSGSGLGGGKGSGTTSGGVPGRPPAKSDVAWVMLVGGRGTALPLLGIRRSGATVR